MLLDTSVLIELLHRPEEDRIVQEVLQAVGAGPMIASTVHLGEIADATRRKGLSVEEALAKAQEIAEFVPVDSGIAIEASNLKAEARRRRHGRDFSLIDGIGLATARARGLRLLTLNPEFAGFEDAVVLRR